MWNKHINTPFSVIYQLPAQCPFKIYKELKLYIIDENPDRWI